MADSHKMNEIVFCIAPVEHSFKRSPFFDAVIASRCVYAGFNNDCSTTIITVTGDNILEYDVLVARDDSSFCRCMVL